MNANYVLEYVDTNGKIVERSKISSIRTFIFACIKFFSDRILSLLGLIILSPLMLLIAIAIKIEDGGPVFFRQIRTGKNGKNFKLIKFRSMSVNNDVHDFSKSDQHTKVGKFLRKTSLDEIPQLINVYC